MYKIQLSFIMLKKYLNWYLLNLKNKKLKNLKIIISRNLNNLINSNIILVNIDFIKIKKYYFKNKIIYKYKKHAQGFKKIKFSNFYKNNSKEFIKNYIIKSFKNNKLKKILKKNIKFIGNLNNIKNFKNKILNLI